MESSGSQYCNAPCRGTFEINDTVEVAATGHLPDTFLDLSAWGKGVAFVNGFNLGWYWPSIGPQNHYFVPGPRLRKGRNEVLLLELERLPAKLTGNDSLSPAISH